MLEFDEVVAPLGQATFLREHWLKTFLHIRGTRGRFAGLLTWNDLSAILEQHRLTPPRLKLFQDGRAVDPSRYLTSAAFGVPRIDAGGLAVCIARGATLILDDAQELAPNIRDLIESFQLALHTDAYINLYAGWHGQNAFNLHWDPQEAMVLQLSGRKQWQVYGPTRAHPLKQDLEAPAPPTAPPVWEGILEDGDVLYIPRGWWHIATPLNEPSLHLTVSMTPPTGLDYMSWVIARLRSHPDARRSLQAGDAPMAGKLHKLLGEMLTPKGMKVFLSEWEANIRPNPHIDLPEAAYRQLSPVTAQSAIRLAGLHRLFLVPHGDGFEFKAAGKIWQVPRSLEGALASLNNAQIHTVAALCQGMPEHVRADLISSLNVLAQNGVVLVEHPG